MHRTTYNKEKLENAVKISKCYSDILRNLGLFESGGGSRVSIRKYCKLWNIDLSHLLTVSEFNKQNHIKFNKRRISLEEILIENSTYSNRAWLKARLYKSKLKEKICELCGQTEIWKGKKMSLILDHINGINNDNRLNNLRIVCPNCNATLDTHCRGKRANGETASHTPPER
jgi:hypothetical protein